MKLETWSNDFGYTQIVGECTRYHRRQDAVIGSMLDLCFARSSGNLSVTASVIKLPFSDHSGLIVSISKPKSIPTTLRYIKWQFPADLVKIVRDNPFVRKLKEIDLELYESELTDWLTSWETKAQKLITKVIKPYHKPWYTKLLSELETKFLGATDQETSKRLRTAYVNASRSAKKKHMTELASKMSKNGGIFKI